MCIIPHYGGDSCLWNCFPQLDKMIEVSQKMSLFSFSRNAQELSASDLLFLNLLVEASQVKELGQIEECETDNEINTETVDHRKDDDGIEVDSSDSGEFYSIPSTPSLGRHAGLVEGKSPLMAVFFEGLKLNSY